MAAVCAVLELLWLYCLQARAALMSKATLHEKVNRMVADVMVENFNRPEGRRWTAPFLTARVVRKCARDGLRITQAQAKRETDEIMDRLCRPAPDDLNP
jgi:hypothetical protein